MNYKVTFKREKGKKTIPTKWNVTADNKEDAVSWVRENCTDKIISIESVKEA